MFVKFVVAFSEFGPPLPADGAGKVATEPTCPNKQRRAGVWRLRLMNDVVVVNEHSEPLGNEPVTWIVIIVTMAMKKLLTLHQAMR